MMGRPINTCVSNGSYAGMKKITLDIVSAWNAAWNIAKTCFNQIGEQADMILKIFARI